MFAAQEILEYSEPRLLEMRYTELVHPDHVARLEISLKNNWKVKLKITYLSFL